MRESFLNPRYTFESFVTGESNSTARDTAVSIAKQPGARYNPCVLYNEMVGLGTTHLMHAIGNEIHRLNPGADVLFKTCVQFSQEYGLAAQTDTLAAFRARYHSLDCLLIDGIQFLSIKGDAAQELIDIFTALFDAGKQIVVTSDRSIKELSPLNRELSSWLERGFATEVMAPDLETRIAILRKENNVGVPVSADVLQLLAASVKITNVRALEGSLIRIKAFQSMTSGGAVSVDDAREICKDYLA